MMQMFSALPLSQVQVELELPLWLSSHPMHFLLQSTRLCIVSYWDSASDGLYRHLCHRVRSSEDHDFDIGLTGLSDLDAIMPLLLQVLEHLKRLFKALASSNHLKLHAYV